MLLSFDPALAQQRAGRAELIATFREQHVAGDDPLVFGLHLSDLRLLHRRWARACCSSCPCFS